MGEGGERRRNRVNVAWDSRLWSCRQYFFSRTCERIQEEGLEDKEDSDTEIDMSWLHKIGTEVGRKERGAVFGSWDANPPTPPHTHTAD